MKIKIILTSVVIAIFIGVATSVIMVKPNEAKSAGMVNHCSAVVRENMKSPESYKLIKGATIFEDLDRDLTEEILSDSAYLKSELADGRITASKVQTFINFQSVNSFGVSLQGSAECTYFSIGQGINPLIGASIDGIKLSNAFVLTSATDELTSIGGFFSKVRYLLYKVSGKI